MANGLCGHGQRVCDVLCANQPSFLETTWDLMGFHHHCSCFADGSEAYGLGKCSCFVAGGVKSAANTAPGLRRRSCQVHCCSTDLMRTTNAQIDFCDGHVFYLKASGKLHARYAFCYCWWYTVSDVMADCDFVIHDWLTVFNCLLDSVVLWFGGIWLWWGVPLLLWRSVESLPFFMSVCLSLYCCRGAFFIRSVLFVVWTLFRSLVEGHS